MPAPRTSVTCRVANLIYFLVYTAGGDQCKPRLLHVSGLQLSGRREEAPLLPEVTPPSGQGKTASAFLSAPYFTLSINLLAELLIGKWLRKNTSRHPSSSTMFKGYTGFFWSSEGFDLGLQGLHGLP